MIVVIGAPALMEGPGGPAPAGLAGRVATVAAEAGADVQLAGRIGDDPAGDRLLIALASAGVGHVAVLRDPATPTSVIPDLDGRPAASAEDHGAADGREPAWDEELAAPAGRLVGVEPGDGRDAGDPVGAEDVPAPELDAGDIELALRYLVDFRVLVVATPLDPTAARVVGEAATYAGAEVVVVARPGGRPPDVPRATVLDMPVTDPDGRFVALVAAFSVALDAGVPPAEAFSAALAAGGWEPVAS